MYQLKMDEPSFTQCGLLLFAIRYLDLAFLYNLRLAVFAGFSKNPPTNKKSD